MNINKCNSSQCTVETVIDSKRINILACLFFSSLLSSSNISFPCFYVAAFAESESQPRAWKDWTFAFLSPLYFHIYMVVLHWRATPSLVAAFCHHLKHCLLLCVSPPAPPLFKHCSVLSQDNKVCLWVTFTAKMLNIYINTYIIYNLFLVFIFLLLCTVGFCSFRAVVMFLRCRFSCHFLVQFRC